MSNKDLDHLVGIDRLYAWRVKRLDSKAQLLHKTPIHNKKQGIENPRPSFYPQTKEFGSLYAYDTQ